MTHSRARRSIYQSTCRPPMSQHCRPYIYAFFSERCASQVLPILSSLCSLEAVVHHVYRYTHSIISVFGRAGDRRSVAATELSIEASMTGSRMPTARLTSDRLVRRTMAHSGRPSNRKKADGRGGEVNFKPRQQVCQRVMK